VLIKLIDSCNDPHTGFDQLTEIIQQDAAITSKVISAANSPFFRQWQEISDLNRLLVVLGIRSVRTIAINSAVQQFFSQLGKSAGRAVERIWYYSLVCAHCAKSLAELTTYPSPDEAYLAGLLHRLGQLALLQTFTDDYRGVVDEGLNGEALTQAEKERVGYSSAAVAAELIDSWQLHSFISDAVLYQNEPANSILDSAHLVKLVNLARDLAIQERTIDSRALERADLLFGLNQGMLEKLLQESRETAIATANSLNIALPDEAEVDETVPEPLQALGERIRQAALLSGGIASLPDKSSLAMTLLHIQRDLELLFGVNHSCFLLLDDENKKLQPSDPASPDDSRLKDLVISIGRARSLAAKAYLEQRLHSNENELESESAVVDRQMARYLKRKILSYLPLATERRPLGLIAIGSHPAEWAALKEQLDMLTLFAKEAAQTMQRQREMEQLQNQLISEERDAFYMEARKVVHEANNPLGIINNYLHILGMKLGETHPVQEELDIIKEEIERVGKIILRIRDIPADIEMQQRTVDLNQLIEDLNKLFASSLFPSRDISSTLDLDRSMRGIRTQRNHIKQILTNLIKNAVEAMELGGHLTLATRDNAYINGKAYVEIQVIDDGPGIPQDIMEQLFTPVTSTKGSTHSGLGLAIVKNLTDDLSGHISCISNAGQGTRFRLYLPRSSKTKKS
jgi:signal transduction histidine kinase/HD-like signal output (HDOD) protein